MNCLKGNYFESYDSDPVEPELLQMFEQDVKVYSVVIIREADFNPLTGIWAEKVEDSLNIHETSKQEAHEIADFISALPFRGQLKRTYINRVEHFNQKL